MRCPLSTEGFSRRLRQQEPPSAQFPDIQRQSPMLPVQYLDRCPGLADEYERLVLGDVASELSIDDSLQSPELLVHVHGLHAEVVPQIRMKLAYC